MMEQLIYWVQEDASGLGRPQLAGDAPTNNMAVPMMLLCLVHQITEGRGPDVVGKYQKLGSWCVQQILQHIQVGPQRKKKKFITDMQVNKYIKIIYSKISKYMIANIILKLFFYLSSGS